MGKVIHLIPFDGIGGVESAAHSCSSEVYSDILYDKYFISDSFGSSSAPVRPIQAFLSRPANVFLDILRGLFYLERQKPRLIIASLWMSYYVVILHKLIHPRAKVVCFLHCNRAVHPLDWILALLAMALASEIWTDSQATLSTRVPLCWNSKSRVISFVLRRVSPVNSETPKPVFVFWGRLCHQKGLYRSISLIAALKSFCPEAQFKVIGPDRGQLSLLKNLVHKLDLHSTVEFLGPKGFVEIKSISSQASFYLQTSLFEGMAVSVIEAMQFGLVPVVTPVGEVSRYCFDDINSIIVDPGDIDHTVFRIRTLLSNHSLYSIMRQRAISAWYNTPTYCEDLIRFSRALLPC